MAVYRGTVTAVEEVTGQVGALQPRQLIVSLYGLYAREHGSWLSVAAVVRLMAALGVEEPAVRSSISRLKRRGLLDARRVDGVAGYALTEVAQEILADGDARIFGRRRAEESDGWLLVVFSVPESERDKRHQLRSQLTRLGFGTVAPGVWVAPGHLADEAAEVLDRRGLVGYVELFRGAHLGAVREQVARWWDLDQLHARYAEFLDRQEPVRVAGVACRRSRAGLRRLRPPAHRLAATALRRPRSAARSAARGLERGAGGGPVRRAERAARRPRPRSRPPPHRRLRRLAQRGRAAMPCTSTSASSSQSRAMPMPAIAG